MTKNVFTIQYVKFMTICLRIPSSTNMEGNYTGFISRTFSVKITKMHQNMLEFNTFKKILNYIL